MPSSNHLTDDQRADWLQLIRSDGIGPISFYRLLARFGNAADACAALPGLARASIRLAEREVVLREIQKTKSFGARLIANGEPDYPPALAAIPDPPPLIAVRGDLSLSKPSVAIVGARNASAIGRRMASELANGLGEAGITVVSGLARGIDGAAHLAAMNTGTVAVIAGGIDQIYPAEHAGLYQAIAENGAVVSEVRYGHVARAQDFPKRNRIVSGLSRAVIVVEAAHRSGTLITARLGNEQGRDVFAVPGSPLDPRSAGTNELIRQGATLVRNAQDVIDGLEQSPSGLADTPVTYDPAADDGEHQDDPEFLRQAVLDLLGPVPVHRDELIRELTASSHQVADALLDLTLEGLVEESVGGAFSRTASSLSAT